MYAKKSLKPCGTTEAPAKRGEQQGHKRYEGSESIRSCLIRSRQPRVERSVPVRANGRLVTVAGVLNDGPSNHRRDTERQPTTSRRSDR